MNYRKSPLTWLGGKSLLADTIISYFPDHTCYVEVFCGGASVLFRKDSSKVEVINDINSHLVNFFDVVRTAKYELIAELQYNLLSRELFYRFLSKLDDPELPAVRKAAYFFYILKLSFGGQGKHWGVSTTSPARLNLERVEEIITAAHERVRRVTIENRDFREILRIYDRAHTLFYLDPPYRVASSRAYGAWLTDEDYQEMRDILRGIKGKFILSINDDPWIRELFSEFRIEEVETTYSVAKDKSKRVKELLILNF